MAAADGQDDVPIRRAKFVDLPASARILPPRQPHHVLRQAPDPCGGHSDPPAERATVQHAAVHRVLRADEAAARGAHPLVLLVLLGRGGRLLGASSLLFYFR